MIHMLLPIVLVIIFMAIGNPQSQSKTSCYVGKKEKVSLLGDSLMRRAVDFLDLTGEILKVLRDKNNSLDYDIDFNSSAADSSRIADIRNKQLWPAVDYQPDATIIFWDTDVSDVSEWGMDPQAAEDLRNTFRTNVDYVVGTLLNYTNTRLALTGPGVLGEDRIIKQPNFWHKTTMIREYFDIVSDVCASYNVTYIDIRDLYLQNVPVFKGSLPGFSFTRLFLKSHYFISEDGEHPNFRACKILADQFGSLLFDWLYSGC